MGGMNNELERWKRWAVLGEAKLISLTYFSSHPHQPGIAGSYAEYPPLPFPWIVPSASWGSVMSLPSEWLNDFSHIWIRKENTWRGQLEGGRLSGHEQSDDGGKEGLKRFLPTHIHSWGLTINGVHMQKQLPTESTLLIHVSELQWFTVSSLIADDYEVQHWVARTLAW